MRVDKKLREVFREISNKSLEYMNYPDQERKYIKRLLKRFEKFTEDERIYIVKVLFEELRYKNIIVDEDNIVNLHNLQLKKYTYILVTSLAAILFIIYFYRSKASFDTIETFLEKIITLMSL